MSHRSTNRSVIKSQRKKVFKRKELGGSPLGDGVIPRTRLVTGSATGDTVVVCIRVAKRPSDRTKSERTALLPFALAGPRILNIFAI
ncbi:hypothetical protein GWI33_017471 [Rhynchophorus ferrugineus]|uniref:Uncharacterized protein n=1 Tax=Rhynchophorus ferrugineus TaxID=354439 RepID=A0A834I1Y6_RHYFE|nr:hypothetical protein GWI33_017471 [Rhynchophorus ferrugineus]